MSGIAALAAAAAATQKINTTAGVTTTPVSGIKVVTPTVVSSSGVKVTPVSGRTSELVVSSRLAGSSTPDRSLAESRHTIRLLKLFTDPYVMRRLQFQ